MTAKSGTDSAAQATAASGLSAGTAGVRVREIIHPDPVIRLTARHMLASHSGTAPVTVLAEADANGLVAARRRLIAVPGAPRVSYSQLLVKILAEALLRHPRRNAAFGEDGVTVFDETNIGVAMAMPDGNLVVPVVHHADRLGLLEIIARLDELQARGRAGKLRTADVRNGTFTLSNAGMVAGVRWTTPLLNLPQCAILATGTLVALIAAPDATLGLAGAGD